MKLQKGIVYCDTVKNTTFPPPQINDIKNIKNRHVDQQLRTLYERQDIAQQAQNICITFVQRRPNVFDVGATLCKCYTNVLCLLGDF